MEPSTLRGEEWAVFGVLTPGLFLPSTESIRAALALVEFRLIAIDRNRVGLPRAGMAIGLGGMAKGYALDRAGAVLRKLGFDDFLIDGGGDLLCSGKRQGQPWRIGVQVPRGDRRELVALLKANQWRSDDVGGLRALSHRGRGPLPSYY